MTETAGLHGEAADELARAAVLPQIGEDVMGAGQRDGQLPVLLFHLVPAVLGPAGHPLGRGPGGGHLYEGS